MRSNDYVRTGIEPKENGSELDRSRARCEEMRVQAEKAQKNMSLWIPVLHEKLETVNELFKQLGAKDSDLQKKIDDGEALITNWEKQVKTIETVFQKQLSLSQKKSCAGATLGIGVATLGPSAAMGLATTFGVASTGTAISTLSGAAATNAALACIGGGALVAGGGGMFMGQLILRLAGPVGWGLAGAAVLGHHHFAKKHKEEKARLDSIFMRMAERDYKKYKLTMLEIKNRTVRIQNEIKNLDQMIPFLKRDIEETEQTGEDCRNWNEEKMERMKAHVNQFLASAQLLTNQIKACKTYYTEQDLKQYFKARHELNATRNVALPENQLLCYLCNQFYHISFSVDDANLVGSVIKQNKELLKSYNIEQFDSQIVLKVRRALQYKEKLENLQKDLNKLLERQKQSEPGQEQEKRISL